MRRSLAVLFGLLLATHARAAVPTTFSVQGVLRNSSGQLQSMMVNVTITLYDTQTAGMGNKLAGPFGPSAAIASNGLFTLTLTDANLVSELSSAPEVWLEMIVGNDTFPRQRVTPELFALMSGQADNALKLGGVAAASYVTSSSLTTTLGSYVTSSSLTSALSSYVTQSSLTSTLGLYETTSAATAAFQPKGSYEPLLSSATCPSGQAYASISSSGAVACTGTVTSAASADALSATCATNKCVADADINSVSAAKMTGTLPIANGGTGSTTQNFVDISSNQPVAGIKYFTHSLYSCGANDNATIWLGDQTRSYLGVTTSLPPGPPNGGPCPTGANGGLGFYGTQAEHVFISYYPNLNSIHNATLYVTGLANAQYNDATVTLQVNGPVAATSFPTSSDARLKTNVTPLQHALDHVKRLRGVNYVLKATNEPSIGFIAQEVEKVFPQLVGKEGHGYKTVDYSKLTAVLAEAIKTVDANQQTRADALEKENAALRTRVDRLEAAVQKLATTSSTRSRLAAK